MSAYEKIRAAINRECPNGGSDAPDEALAALAELEKAAAEPLFILTTGAIGSDGEQDDWDIECDSSRRLESFCAAHPGSTVALYAAPPAPVAGIREAEVTDEMCDSAYLRKWESQTSLSGAEPDDEDRQWAREWLAAWRAELGPTLGLVELKEPTPEECERIYSFWIGAEGCNGRTPGERMGRIMFDACRAVMCPKEGL